MSKMNGYFMDECERGYSDGLSDKREALPQNTNYSTAYVHGRLNGRDDRMRKPRAPADDIRAAADKIMGD